MRIPVNARCYACGQTVAVFMTLPDPTISFRCSRGHDNAGPVDSEIGTLVLDRAQYELLTNQDLSLTIIFAAMGLEVELSRLHHTWHRIAASEEAREASDEELDEMLRRNVNIKERIEKVAILLHKPGLDAFVGESEDICRIVTEGYPSLQDASLAEGIQRSLFWPRNRILHLGEMARNREDALRALNVARLGV